MPDDADPSLKHRLEHAVFRSCSLLVRHLPAPAAYGGMERLLLIAHECFGWRKQETQARIQQVFPDRPSVDRKRIRRESVRNLARNITDLMVEPKDVPASNQGKQETFQAIGQARSVGKGVILVIAHTGNWDTAGVATARQGFPMCFIARKQKNSLVYDELVKAREQTGGTVVDRHDPRLIRKLLAELAENKVVAILVDIRARTAGDTFRYLGHDAWLTNGLGLLAAKSGAEVLPVYLGREGRNRHIWIPKPVRRLTDSNRDKPHRDELLQSCLDDLSEEILRRPECYFWFNKRWVLEPFEGA